MRKLFVPLIFGIAALFAGCTTHTEQGSVGDEPSTRSADSYYYYFDEKIYLDRNPEHLYVIFEEEQLQSLNLSKATTSMTNVPENVGEINYRVENIHMQTSASAVGQKKLMAGTFKASEINNRDVYYQMPCYKNKHGKDVVFSNVFYVYLKSENDIAILEQLALEYSVDILRNNNFNPLMWLLACNPASAGNSLEMANTFHETGLFTTAEPDCISFEQHQVFDPLWSSQWNLHLLDLDWTNLQSTGEGIIVAVSDRGVQTDHPDLPNVIHSYDTTNDSSINVGIYNPHGTACAGIIGAAIFNGIGIMGLAPDVGILSLNVNGAAWSLMAEEYANSIWYATDYGADVINCSWGWEPTAQITMAIDHAVTNGRNGKGCVVVVSSGNSAESILGEPYISFPASLANTIAVGAMYQTYTRCPFSQYGGELDVIAPGLNVPTTKLQGWDDSNWGTGDYTSFPGTSAAAPHVSAAAALILSLRPHLTYSAVKQIICETAKKNNNYSFAMTAGKPYGTWNKEVGYGLLDINRALTATQEVKDRNDIYINKEEPIAIEMYGDCWLCLPISFSTDKNVNESIRLTIQSFCLLEEGNEEFIIHNLDFVINQGSNISNTQVVPLFDCTTYSHPVSMALINMHEQYPEITNVDAGLLYPLHYYFPLYDIEWYTEGFRENDFDQLMDYFYIYGIPLSYFPPVEFPGHVLRPPQLSSSHTNIGSDPITVRASVNNSPDIAEPSEYKWTLPPFSQLVQNTGDSITFELTMATYSAVIRCSYRVGGIWSPEARITLTAY